MRHRRSLRTLVVLLLCLAPGCATRFSPELVRQEILLQRGHDPLETFELNLGRFTTFLIKSALTADDGTTPFAGLAQLQLGVYDVDVQTGPAIDVTRIPVRGWEQIIRIHDDNRSGMVLIRSGGETIGDLVVVGAGKRKVVYGRLSGSLDAELPATLGEILRDGGPERLREVLVQLAGEQP